MNAIAIGAFGLMVLCFALFSTGNWGNADSGESYTPRARDRWFTAMLGVAMICIAFYLRLRT